jgi:prepilin-type N-terminal cleavage/methylation domain-containing protein
LIRNLGRKAFTIIELMIVITIILVLSALLFPVFKTAKESTYKGVALTQAQQLGQALMLYLQDSNSKYLPATNYGVPDSSSGKMWPQGLRMFAKSEQLFVAPGTDGVFPRTFSDRGLMTIGYSSATSIDMTSGCDDEQANQAGCISFNSSASFDKGDKPADIALFALTPGGPTDDKYRGYEFNPYNGVPQPDRLPESPPLVSDRDLVKELAPLLPAPAIEPVYARYMATGHDTGMTFVIFADGHAKDFSAASISGAHTGIVWQFR